MNNNDEKILGLKKQIVEKKDLLGKSQRFNPITNCSLELNGQRFNLHTLNREGLEWLAIQLHTLNKSAEELGYTGYLSGFYLSDWLTDIKNKLLVLNRQNEEKKLKVLEDRLHELLSTDKKIELELDDIMKAI